MISSLKYFILLTTLPVGLVLSSEFTGKDDDLKENMSAITESSYPEAELVHDANLGMIVEDLKSEPKDYEGSLTEPSSNNVAITPSNLQKSNNNQLFRQGTNEKSFGFSYLLSSNNCQNSDSTVTFAFDPLDHIEPVCVKRNSSYFSDFSDISDASIDRSVHRNISEASNYSDYAEDKFLLKAPVERNIQISDDNI